MPSSNPTVTALIITNRADGRFFECLESVKTADEILAIDNTAGAELSKRATLHQNLKVISHPDAITNFSLIKNRYSKKAQGEWLLFIDSDERLQADGLTLLKKMITPKLAGVSVIRSDVFYGKTLTRGEAGNLRLIRFIRKEKACWEGSVHETLRVLGAVVASNVVITHSAHTSIEEFFADIAWYAKLVAEHKTTGPLKTTLEMIFFPAGKLARAVFVQRVLADGWRGLVYAVLMSFHSLFVRVYRYEAILQKQ